MALLFKPLNTLHLLIQILSYHLFVISNIVLNIILFKLLCLLRRRFLLLLLLQLLYLSHNINVTINQNSSAKCLPRLHKMALCKVFSSKITQTCPTKWSFHCENIRIILQLPEQSNSSCWFFWSLYLKSRAGIWEII